MCTEIPIWAQGNPKPARVRLIQCKTELMAGMGIIKKLDIIVRLVCDQFKVGQSEWEMMTCNGKHHWVFHLSPTAFSYATLGEYFGKLQNSKIEVLQAQGDFGRNFPVRNVSREKSNDCKVKWKPRSDNFRNGRHGAEYTLTRGKYDFPMFRGWQ